MNKQIHAITLVVFMIGLLAPACGFAWGGKYSVIDICTAQGIETKIIADSSDSEDGSSHSLEEKCPFCVNKLIDKVVLSQKEKSSNLPTKQFQLTSLYGVYHSIKHRAYQSRAPPVLIEHSLKTS